MAGDDGRSSSVAFFEDFEEIVTSGGVEELKIPIVEDEQLRAPAGCGAVARNRAA
jgi:hypothetical protein